MLGLPMGHGGFGDAVRTKVQEHQQRWGEGVGYVERETLDAFLQLPATERKIIREVIWAFIKARGNEDEKH